MVVSAIARRLRNRRIQRLVAALQGAPRSRQAIMPVVAKLREAWGNTGWSADLGYLGEIVEQSLGSRGPFLECGAGLSTVVLGALGDRDGTSVWTLEQDADWVQAMGDRLAALGLRNVELVHAPLSVVDGAAWYTFDDARMPRAFPAVFCDGPSVRRSLWPTDVYRQWRSRLVTELGLRQMAFGVIVLDDAEDMRCPTLVEAWRRVGLGVEIVETPFGRHVVAAPSGTAGPPPA